MDIQIQKISFKGYRCRYRYGYIDSEAAVSTSWGFLEREL